MNFGWSTPLDSEYGVLAKKFKELAEKYSNGTISVKLRCCAQVGNEDDAFNALQLGTVDAYIVSQNNISPHWPLMDVFVLPYIFQSTDHLLKVADGPLGQKIADQLEKATAVHLLTFGGPSYRDIFNSKRPINRMEDMTGLKMRVPNNEVMLATFSAFDSEPVPLAWSDTPTALQTGTIDGGDNGTSVIKEMKFYEFAKYLTIIDHFAGFSPLLASDRFMKELDDAQRQAVLKAAKEAGDFQTKYEIDQTEKVRTWLTTTGGMQATRPDTKEFIAAAKKVQEKFAKARGQDFVDLVNEIQSAAD
jgi:tripartite ATP-independent transporter DctP family solute receptor